MHIKKTYVVAVACSLALAANATLFRVTCD